MKKPLSVAVLACAAASTQAGAAAICVSPTVKSCRPTIQAGVAAATSGDTVTIGPGTYYENVVVPPGKDGLTITGNPLGTVVDPDAPNTGSAFVIQSSGVSLRNLTIRDGRTDAVAIEASDAAVQGLTILGTGGSGVFVAPGVTGSQILANHVRGAAVDGIVLAGGNDRSVVASNTVAQTGAFGIDALGASIQVVGNRVQLGSRGIHVIGDGAVVARNDVELSRAAAIDVSGANPTVDQNAVAAGGAPGAGSVAIGIVVACTTCTGGSVTGNTSAGYVDGIAANTDAAGFRVEKNRASALHFPFTLTNGVAASANTASGSVPGFECFATNSPGATGNVLTRNTVTRCGGVGFLSLSGNDVFDSNVANDANGYGFEVDGGGGLRSGVVLKGNKAIGTNGEGIGVVNGAVGTTVTGNAGSKNRLDFCDTTGSSAVSGNTFAGTSTSCDVLQ